MAELYKYDVALSFAGEEREYVEAVATHLRNSKIKVFYDVFEEVNLWGKDLYTHLDDVYRNKARFCVMFISENYQRKNWTNHERESAQTRAFQENEEYILPARFDNTEIPGVRPTIGYISLRNFTPQQFAQIIIQKLKLARSSASRPTKFSSKASYLKSCEKATNINKNKLHQSRPLSPNKSRAKANYPKPTKKVTGVNKRKSYQMAFANNKETSNKVNAAKPKSKTVALTFEGIGQLPNDKPIVYKILTEGKKNNYTGIAKRGNIFTTLQEHLQGKKNYVPGFKIHIEQMNSIQEAQEKADRIIRKSKSKYNESANN